MADEQTQPEAAAVLAAPAASEGDLSKRTLVVLVALSVLVSLVGTVAMVYQLSGVGAAPTIVEGQTQASAEVGFGINGPAQPKTSGATGFATFRIGE